MFKVYQVVSDCDGDKLVQGTYALPRRALESFIELSYQQFLLTYKGFEAYSLEEVVLEAHMDVFNKLGLETVLDVKNYLEKADFTDAANILSAICLSEINYYIETVEVHE